MAVMANAGCFRSWRSAKRRSWIRCSMKVTPRMSRHSSCSVPRPQGCAVPHGGPRPAAGRRRAPPRSRLPGGSETPRPALARLVSGETRTGPAGEAWRALASRTAHDQGDRSGEALPLLGLLGEHLAAGARESVVLGAPVVLGKLPLGL